MILPRFYIFLFFLLVFLACRNKGHYTSRPSKSIVNPDSELIEAHAVAYHDNDSATHVYLEIKNENLLYKRPDTSMVFYAHLRVSYQLQYEHNTRKIVDSGSFYILDRAGGEEVQLRTLYAEFDVAARRGDNYFLDLNLIDLNRRTRNGNGINIYKQSRFSNQNFLVRRKDSIAFNNNFKSGELVNIRVADPVSDQVKVDCFLKDFGPALPPFTVKPPDETRYKPDSVFTKQLVYGAFHLQMPERGFYHVRLTDTLMEGLTLQTYDEHFPGVGSATEMINCARYIMSRDEYESCLNAVDKKQAIDKFWLTIGGSNERARELLKRYYGRVKEANKYYSTYTQGWKSDRGMVFIIFGYPTNIYKGRKDEIWVYGNEANPAALRFVFNKTQNPYSDNEYIMERSQFYKDPWFTAVDYWRQGHVYIDNRK